MEVIMTKAKYDIGIHFGEMISNTETSGRCQHGCCIPTASLLARLRAHGQLVANIQKNGEYTLKTASNNPHEVFTLRGYIDPQSMNEEEF
jgi:hypothetical protein